MNNSSTSTVNTQTVNSGFAADPNNSTPSGSSGTNLGSTKVPERSEWLKDPMNLKRLVKSIGANSDSSCTSRLSEGDLAFFNYSMEELLAGLKAHTWKDLEVGRDFKENDKIALITEDTLIVGVDVASDKFDLRAFDKYGTELTVKALSFPKSRDGFDQCRNALCELAVLYGKSQIIVGCEPTGHYWMNQYFDFTEHGMTVFLVNPYAVNRTKEISDNLQTKSDSKDPKVIAQLVRDGHYSVPYLAEGDYAEARDYANLFENANEDHCRWVNRLHRWCDIHWPELKAVYNGNIDAPGCLEILSNGLTPKAVLELGAEGICNIFEAKKFRGNRKKMADKVYEAAVDSIGSSESVAAAIDAAKYIVSHIRLAEEERNKFEEKMTEYAVKIYPNLNNIAKVGGITLKTSARFIADLGDITRFSDPAEIVKLSGLCPVLNQSGKWKGIPKVSKRGRKRLRATLYIMADNVVKYDTVFKEILEYYTTRSDNQLKRKEALMIVCNKLVRIIFHLLCTGEAYDPEKMRKQIKRPAVTEKSNNTKTEKN